jgi:phytol kinase
MNGHWTILIQLGLCFLALFAIAELLYHIARWKAEHTRKLVHAGTGILTLLFPLYLDHLWQVVVICLAFLLLLWMSMRFHFLKSINAVKRQTSGSILYPLIVIISFAYFKWQEADTVFEPYLHFYLPILIMAIADPVAAIAGSANQRIKRSPAAKSNTGSLGFFLTALAISILLLIIMPSSLNGVGMIAFILAISLSATLAERYTNGGWDNFTIPLAAIAVMFITSIIAGK